MSVVQVLCVDGQKLTEADVAGLLQVKTQTVAAWRMRGTGPRYIKLAGIRGGIRYDRADVDHWLEDRKRTSTSEGE